MEKQPTYTKQVIEIADYLFKYPDKKMSVVLSYFVRKCHKTERTVNRYIKQAKAYNQTRLNKQEEIKDKVLSEQTKKAVKSAIISRNESLEILSSIAKGTAKEIPVKLGPNEKPIEWNLEYPSDSDRTRAIQQLSKMQGWDNPTKLDVTTKGESINSGITPSELKELSNAIHSVA